MTHPCYCISLRKVTRQLTSIYDEALAPFGINISQFSQLRTIRYRQPVSLSDVAGYLELDRSTVGRNTKVLQRMGLVKTLAGDDQRESVLALTPEAEKMLEEATPVWRALQGRVAEKLDGAQIDRLLLDIKEI
jgi:DNA-binding MarR family transcriptional regulator